MIPTASFQCVWETLRCLICDQKKEQLLNFHIVTPKFQLARLLTYFKSLNVKYFKVIKRLKSLEKAEAYLESKQASMMELFSEYTQRLTISAIKGPSKMFDWVILRS